MHIKSKSNQTHQILIICFCLISFSTARGQDIDWAYGFNGSGDSQINDLIVIDNQLLLASGSISNGTDIDLLATQQIVSTNFDLTPYIGIYNTEGQLINFITASAEGSIEQTDIFANGDILVGGNLSGDVQWQNNPGVMSIPSENQSDIFLSRFNSDLQLIWQWSMGGTSIDSLNDVVIGDDSHIYFSGQYRGQITLTIDGLPVTFSTHDYIASQDEITPDSFVACLDENGNLLWFRGIGSVGYDQVSHLNQQGTHLAIIGIAAFDTYFHDILMYPSFYKTCFVILAETDGELNWFRQDMSYFHSHMGGVDFSSNQIHVVGRYALPLDFDESDEIDALSSLNSGDAFYAGFELDGTVAFMHSMGGQQRDEFNFLDIRNEDEIMVCANHGGSSDYGINGSLLLGASGPYSSSFFVYDSQGSVASYLTISTANYTKINAVARIGDSYFLATELMGTAIFDYDENVQITSSGGYDAVLAKYAVCTQPVCPEILLEDVEICRYDSVQITLVGGQLNDAVDWAYTLGWIEDLIPFNGATNLMISPQNSSTIRIKGVGGCVGLSVDSDVEYITVLPAPGGQMTLWTSSMDSCDYNITYSPSLIGPSFEYVWEPPISQNSVAHDLCEGTYYLTVTMDNGCFFYDSIVIASVGLIENRLNELPFEHTLSATNGHINLYSRSHNLGIVICDIQGKLIHQSDLSYGENLISLTALPAGPYISTIYDDKKKYSLKWIWPENK